MNIDKNPIVTKAYKLCVEIEGLGASERLAHVSTLANALLKEIYECTPALPLVGDNVSDIDDHKALSCGNCGSVNFSLLKSFRIECNKCGDLIAGTHWLEVNSKPYCGSAM